VSWSVSGNQSWINLNSSTGSGNGTITLTALANPTVTSRVATITISGTGVTSQLITVTQDGASPVLNVSSYVLTIASQANSTKTFDITSNSSWSLSCDQSWLTISNSSGSGNGTITLTATANPTIASRIATVTISGTGAGTQTITVTQDGGTSGIGDIAKEQFTIHPNPVSEILYLNTNFDVTGIAVYDIGGKLLFHKKITDNQINVSNLPNGIYTLKVELIKGFEVRKFIKQ
jgi:hypothetical protein